MVGYRGPHTKRVGGQFNAIQGNHGETGIWRQFISANTGTTSGYMAGGGTDRFYREQTITALWAAAGVGASKFAESQLPGGQVIAGDAAISTPMALGSQDEVIWRGVTYRIEGDTIPIQMAGHTWFRTLVTRGDTTG